MQLSAAEQQLIELLRVAHRPDLTIRIDVRDRRYAVRIASPGGPGTGSGTGSTFDAAWHNIRATGLGHFC